MAMAHSAQAQPMQAQAGYGQPAMAVAQPMGVRVHAKRVGVAVVSNQKNADSIYECNTFPVCPSLLLSP